MSGRRLTVLALTAAWLVQSAIRNPQSAIGSDWPTWRGNVGRTGCVDGSVGPKAGNVLWVYQPRNELFIASPSAAGDRVLLASVGALGPGYVRCLSASDGKVIWQVPDPTRPGLDAGSLKMQGVVSSPAVAGDLVVVGEGLHQNEKTTLRALSLKDGSLLWAFPVASHLEGSPAIEGGKVYTGAGGQGVVALDAAAVAFDPKAVAADKDFKPAKEFSDLVGKELTAEAAAAAWAKENKRQQEIADKSGEPPVDTPRPAPKVLWQVGAGNKLHCDSSVAVAGGVVYLGTSFLDDEKIGARQVMALSAADGKTLWTAAVKHNPWGPVSLFGQGADLSVLVGCSSIRFDPQHIPEAKGELVCLSAADGKVRWTKEMPGGVLGSVVVSADGKTGFAAATDGKVYAVSLADGKTLWTYAAKGPLFSAPALAGGTLYVADLKGVLHALDAGSGAGVFTVDLAAKIGSSNCVPYGSPAVAGGRVFVTLAGEKGAVVCVGEK
jgi:outer membrane protein assembly factor BamB